MANRLEKAVQFVRDELGVERFRFDLLSQKLQWLEHIQVQQYGLPQWVNLTERDLNSLACRLAAYSGDTNISAAELRTVLLSDLVPAVNPLTEYLDLLPEWTPSDPDFIEQLAMQVKVAEPRSSVAEPRLSAATQRLDVPSARLESGECTMDNAAQQLFCTAFKKWFVAMVASWRKPEVVNHQVLVLIGRQGIYKTTWLEHLLPPELRAYGCKQPSTYDMSKDDRIRVAEFGLINLDEIDSCTQKELNQLKSVITTQDVNERAAYAHTKERRMRVASFCASGNNREFLIDDTGNRRWLPFEVESIQSPFEHRLPYSGIYAQAVYLIEHDFHYWFDLQDINVIESHNEEFRQKRNEEDLLNVYFTPCDKKDTKAQFMTASEIHAKLKMWGYIEKPISLEKFGRLLIRLGYVPYKSHGKRGYVVKIQQPSDSDRYMSAQEAECCDSGAGGVCYL